MALVGQRVTHDLREALFGHLLRLEAAYYDRNPVGRLMTRVLNDVEAVSEAFTSGLLAIAADVITLVGVVAIMLWMDWRLALVTFAIVPVLAAVAAYFRLRARDAYRESPFFDYTAEFCANYDQVAFDSDYKSEPLEHSELMLRAFFGAKTG